ncbi:hypothetical protein ACGYQ5_14420 [Burkholderia pseudomallei]
MRHPYQMARSRASENTHSAAGTVQQRIHWDDDEWRTVVRAAIKEQAFNPDLDDYNAADKAQKKALPINRQRPFYSEAGNPQYRLRSTLAEYYAKMRAEARQTPPQAPAADGVNIDAPQKTQAAVEPVIAPPPEPVVDAAPSSSEPSVAPAARKPLVFWSQDEKMKIARKSRELMFGFEGMKPLEAIRKAIAYELPDDRQRAINTFTEVKWIDDMWREIQRAEEQAALERERAEAEAHEREEAARAIAAQAIAENEVREREQAARAAAEATEHEIERRVTERMAGLSFDGLIRLFAGKVVQTVIGEIGASLYADIETQIEGIAEKVLARHSEQQEQQAIVTRPAHRPRLLVCGLLNQQIEEIKQTFGDMIDLSFAKHRDEGGPKGKDQFHHKDAVIVMADWGGARFRREAKAAGVPVVPVHGTVSNLKKWLDAYLADPSSAQRVSHINGVH